MWKYYWRVEGMYYWRDKKKSNRSAFGNGGVVPNPHIFNYLETITKD